MPYTDQQGTAIRQKTTDGEVTSWAGNKRKLGAHAYNEVDARLSQWMLFDDTCQDNKQARQMTSKPGK